MLSFVIFAACTAPEETPAPVSKTQTEERVIDYVGLCGPTEESSGRWGDFDCEDGCAETDLEATYEAAFWSFASEMTGFSASEVPQHVGLWEIEGGSMEVPTIGYYAMVDWAWFHTRLLPSTVDGRDVTEEEALESMRVHPYFLRPDWNATLRPLEEVEAVVAACEEELGVRFSPTDWCGGQAPEWDTQDFPMYFEFEEHIDGNEYAVAVVYPDGSEEDRCEIETIDDSTC